MRKILLTTLAIAALTGAANAAEGKGWYTGVQGGVNLEQDSALAGSTPAGSNIDFDTGWVGLADAGYRWGNGFRTELEGGYRRNDIDSVSTGGSGNVSAWSAMGNVIYDLGNLYGIRDYTHVTPFVGAGIGAAGVKANLGAPTGVNESDTVLAYQGIAGVTYNVTPAIDLNVSYHYFWTQDPGYSGNGGASYDTEYQNHSILVGMNYNFNAPEKPMVRTQETVSRSQETKTAVTGKEYRVYFPFNSAVLSSEGQQAVNSAAADAKTMSPQVIKLAGYADTSGSAAYNKKLSEKRVAAVKAGLVKQGVAASQIAVAAKGEAAPPVKTGDGVKEPLNRLVTIVLE